MNIRLTFLLPIAFLTACAGRADVPQTISPPPTSGIVTDKVKIALYRGLRVEEGTKNKIDWTKNSFGVSGKPVPTLSLFNVMDKPDVACWMWFYVEAEEPIEPNSIGRIEFPNPPPSGANAAPWQVVFDDVPKGHWSILRTTIGGDSNNQSSTLAADVFYKKFEDKTAWVLDGTEEGCH